MDRIQPREITHESWTEQQQRQLRLSNKKMHTLLEGEFVKMKALSNQELQKVIDNKSQTYSSLAVHAAQETLRKRIDPDDSDVVAV